MNQERPSLEERIKTSLEADVQNLDIVTKKRLLKMRTEALRQSVKHAWLKSDYWLPAAGLALCSVFAIVLALPYLHTNSGDTALDQTAMLELIANPDELDALSDPGFYVWLDEMEEKEDAPNAA